MFNERNEINLPLGQSSVWLCWMLPCRTRECVVPANPAEYFIFLTHNTEELKTAKCELNIFELEVDQAEYRSTTLLAVKSEASTAEGEGRSGKKKNIIRCWHCCLR